MDGWTDTRTDQRTDTPSHDLQLESVNKLVLQNLIFGWSLRVKLITLTLSTSFRSLFMIFVQVVKK